MCLATSTRCPTPITSACTSPPGPPQPSPAHPPPPLRTAALSPRFRAFTWQRDCDVVHIAHSSSIESARLGGIRRRHRLAQPSAELTSARSHHPEGRPCLREQSARPPSPDARSPTPPLLVCGQPVLHASRKRKHTPCDLVSASVTERRVSRARPRGSACQRLPPFRGCVVFHHVDRLILLIPCLSTGTCVVSVFWQRWMVLP